MLKALLYGPNDVRVEDVPLPEPGEGEIRVRMSVATIYGTDVKMYRGYHALAEYPGGFGGEFAGKIDALGPGVSRYAVSERVTFGGLPHCEACRMCLAGRPNLCLGLANPMAGHGHAFAQYAIYPANRVCHLPDGVHDDDAATVSALDLALNLYELAGLPPGAACLVLGVGAVGVGIVQVGAVLGYRVIAVDQLDRQLEMAMRLGAVEALHATAMKDGLAAACPEGPDLVVDLVGNQETIALACGVVTPGGSIVVLAPGAYGVPSAPIVHKELRILGARSGHHQAKALDMIRAGTLGLRGTITHRFPLTQMAEALECAASPQSIRVALDIE